MNEISEVDLLEQVLYFNDDVYAMILVAMLNTVP